MNADGKVIRWETPPNTPFGRGLHSRQPSLALAAAAEQLRRRPRRWGVLYEGEQGTASGIAATVKHGTAPWGPPGAFDACTRKVGDVVTTYARYVGEG